MKNTLLITLILLICSGCASAYKIPDQNTDSSHITLERVGGEIPSGGAVIMSKVDDDFVCKPGQGIINQKKMAVLSKNSIVGDLNKEGLRIEAIPNFRFIVRSTGVRLNNISSYTINMCDVLIDIPTEKGKYYKVQSSFDQQGCDARVIEIGNVEKEITPTSYQKC